MPDGKREKRGKQEVEGIQKFIETIESKNFFDDEIMGMAKDIGENLARITPTKMRQYFDDIKGLRRRMKSGLTEQQVKVQLRLIQSRIAYDVGRASKKDKENWKNFERFLNASINKVMNSSNIEETTDDFITFIEAVYGYFYCKAH